MLLFCCDSIVQWPCRAIPDTARAIMRQSSRRPQPPRRSVLPPSRPDRRLHSTAHRATRPAPLGRCHNPVRQLGCGPWLYPAPRVSITSRALTCPILSAGLLWSLTAHWIPIAKGAPDGQHGGGDDGGDAEGVGRAQGLRDTW